MASFRVMHDITSNSPPKLSIPSTFIANFNGFMPTAVVLYTHLGEFLAPVRRTPGSSIDYEIRRPTVERLMTDLSMGDGESLEFECHSNTEIIVRAYDLEGCEKNSGTRLTHDRVHYRAVIRCHSDLKSLRVNSTFNEQMRQTGHRINHFGSSLGDPLVPVEGNGNGDYFDITRSQWLDFGARHGLAVGSTLVFRSNGDSYKGWPSFTVLIYGPDGSEMHPAVPTGRRPEDHCFHRELVTGDFDDEGSLIIRDRFARKPIGLSSGPMRLNTLYGSTPVEYREVHSGGLGNHKVHRRIAGDWSNIIRAFVIDRPLVKFHLSFVGGEFIRNPQRDIYAMEFFKVGAGGVWPEEEPDEQSSSEESDG